MSSQEVGENRKSLVFVTSELLVMGRAKLRMNHVEERGRLGKEREVRRMRVSRARGPRTLAC